MSKIAAAITKGRRALLDQMRKPQKIVMSAETKDALIYDLSERERPWFRPGPICELGSDRFCGLPIEIDWQMSKGEVRVE